jgi:hypothetical protein
MFLADMVPQWGDTATMRRTCKVSKGYTLDTKAAAMDTIRAALIGATPQTYGAFGHGWAAKCAAPTFAQIAEAKLSKPLEGGSMTFFNHNMTDTELIRAAEVCEGQPLRLMAQRLKTRAAELSAVADAVAMVPDTERAALAGTRAAEALDTIERIIS